MHPTNQRPKSLCEVAERADSLESWGVALGDLLDAINYRRENQIPVESVVGAAPRLLRLVFRGGEIADAFGAALAEHLAAEIIGLPAPAWASEPERFLGTPWYPDESPRIREYLEGAAPPAFRAHGVFVDIDSLARV
jgi:hypothetical protein